MGTLSVNSNPEIPYQIHHEGNHEHGNETGYHDAECPGIAVDGKTAARFHLLDYWEEPREKRGYGEDQGYDAEHLGGGAAGDDDADQQDDEDELGAGDPVDQIINQYAQLRVRFGLGVGLEYTHRVAPGAAGHHVEQYDIEALQGNEERHYD